MLRKLFIIALLSASLTAFTENCILIYNLTIEDNQTLRACRGEDTLFIQDLTLIDNSLRQATDTSLVFRFVYETEPQDTLYRFPTQGDIRGNIWLELRDTVNNCTRNFTITIDTFPFPEIISGINVRDTTLCFGDTLTLEIDVNEVLNVRNIEWWMTPTAAGTVVGDTAVRIVFDSTKLDTRTARYEAVFFGYCTRIFTDITHYVVRDTAFVFFARPPEIHLDLDTILCFDGEGLDTMALDTRLFDYSHYQIRWVWNNDTVGRENSFTITYDRQGEQIIIVRHDFCLRRYIDGVPVVNDAYLVRDTIRINYFNQAWTNPYRLLSLIERDTAVCDNIYITLDATAELPNLTTYHWQGLRIDTVNIHNPIRDVLPGTYTVTLRDSAGCEREFTIDIRVERCDDTIVMPNVFTPNNDGHNDFFRPSHAHRVYNFEMRVYNRQGRLVYEFEFRGEFPTEQEWQGWNGRIGGTESGTEAPTGTYFWAVRYNDIWGRIRREQGTVTLLR